MIMVKMKEFVCLDQVSAVGHAAMFAAIKKYMPNLVCLWFLVAARFFTSFSLIFSPCLLIDPVALLG